MNGVLPTLALVGLAAAGGLVIGQRSKGSRSISPHLAEHPSPLDYTANHGQPVQRLSLHVQGVPPPDARNVPPTLESTRLTSPPGSTTTCVHS